MTATQIISQNLNNYGFTHVSINKKQALLIDALEALIDHIMISGNEANDDILSSKVLEMVVSTLGVQNSEQVAAFASHVLDKTIRYIRSPFTMHHSEAQLLHHPVDLSGSAYLKRIFAEYVGELSAGISSCHPSSFEASVTPLKDPRALQEISSELRIQLADINSGFRRDNLFVGGEIKLHPPGVNDKGSIYYHYDGDPYYAKLLLFLEDQPYADGEFCCSGPQSDSLHEWAHLQTIIQCINFNEIKAMLPGIRVHKLGIFSLMSHMLMSSIQNVTETVYSPSCLKGVVFRGTAVLHRGGNNKRFRRPVFQALLA